MNINKLERVKTSLNLRDRLLENNYTASLAEFKRMPGLLDSEAGLSFSHNLQRWRLKAVSGRSHSMSSDR